MKNKYQCPVCKGEMSVVEGNGTKEGITDGITIVCDNINCTAQEVAGHGSNEINAWKIVQDKYVTRKDRE